jgi:hypothetical protein
VSGSPAITINANPGDKINIIGVVLDGTAITNTDGIQFNSGGRLIIQDSVIRNFAGDGINFAPNSSSPSQLFVSNTLVSDNESSGIDIDPNGSSAVAVGGALSHVNLEGNGTGLTVTSAGPATNVTVSDSVASGNAGIGITTAGPASVMVRNSTITNNNARGLDADNASVIWVTRSTITGNGVGWIAINSATVLTFGDNDIVGNTAGNGAPSTISHE